MLSRVADSLYWMSRYMERTDNIMRVLKTNYASSQDGTLEFTWRPVLKIFTYLEDDAIETIEHDTHGVLQYMVAGKENPNSVYNMVIRSRENARSVQDHITKELWQCLNEFYHLIREDKLSAMLRSGDDPVTTLDTLIRQSMLYYGTSESTMFRGEGFSFMNMGRYLERALQAVDILDVKFSDLSYDLDKTADIMYWKYLLMSVSGYALYLKTYRSGFEARNIVNQVIFNTHFPRSVLYSLNQLQRYFDRLEDLNTEGYRAVNFRIGKLRSNIQYSNLEHVSEVGLHNFLSTLNREIQDIGTALNQHYFAYS